MIGGGLRAKHPVLCVDVGQRDAVAAGLGRDGRGHEGESRDQGEGPLGRGAPGRR